MTDEERKAAELRFVARLAPYETGKPHGFKQRKRSHKFDYLCYKHALECLQKNSEFPGCTLVHGSIVAGGQRIDHAWINVSEMIVFDAILGRFYVQDGYIHTLDAHISATYSHDDAQRRWFQSEHFGPWETPAKP